LQFAQETNILSSIMICSRAVCARFYKLSSDQAVFKNTLEAYEIYFQQKSCVNDHITDSRVKIQCNHLQCM